MAQQAAGFGTSAAQMWVATVCLALLSPTTVGLVSQAVQVCFSTFRVAVPARTCPPLAWRLTWAPARLAYHPVLSAFRNEHWEY